MPNIKRGALKISNFIVFLRAERLYYIESAKGGRGFYSPPLGAIMDIPIDTPLLCGGVVYY
jgi:hypothetical protein